MTDTRLPDDPQTIERLDSVACLLQWMRSMPEPARERFLAAMADRNHEVHQVVDRMLGVVKDPATSPKHRRQALVTIADTLFPVSDQNDSYRPNGAAAAPERPQEATFAQRLREVMEAKQISQQDLADRVGCSQPAISQMLNRNSRPQKKTILKLAEALGVQPCDLWPDIEVAEMLDAVASFQQDDYVMTEAEAQAFRDTLHPNRPKIQAKPLPSRRR